MNSDREEDWQAFCERREKMLQREHERKGVDKTREATQAQQQQAAVEYWERRIVAYVIHERNLLVQEIDEALDDVTAEFEKKLTQVREEIGALRAELTMMQAGIARGEIAELKGSVPMKRRSNDAA